MTTDLPVPDAAVSALVQAFQDDYDELVTDEVQHEERVRAIAAPVVAAYLRRIASVMDGWDLECSGYARDRADQLDPEEIP